MAAGKTDFIRIKKQEDLFAVETLFRSIRKQSKRQPRIYKNGRILVAAAVLFLAGVATPFQITPLLSGAVEETIYAPPDLVVVEENFPDFGQLPVEAGLGSRYISVSLAEQKLQAYENGERVMEAVVSTGAKNYPTPQGIFAIKNKYPMAYSKVAGLYMPLWMAFTRHDGHYLGFHELPQYADGTKEGTEHLGQPFSGGCIRLGVGDAQKFYDWARVGDPVVVY